MTLSEMLLFKGTGKDIDKYNDLIDKRNRKIKQKDNLYRKKADIEEQIDIYIEVGNLGSHYEACMKQLETTKAKIIKVTKEVQNLINQVQEMQY